jgi:hypothetical protein
VRRELAAGAERLVISRGVLREKTVARAQGISHGRQGNTSAIPVVELHFLNSQPEEISMRQ